MATKTIFTVGFELPTSSIFQYKSFHSNTSLLDADIVLFEPNMSYELDYPSQYNGKPNLSDKNSVACLASIKHWNIEITTAYESGKTILIFYLHQRMFL